MDNFLKYKDTITGDFKYKRRGFTVRRQLQYDPYDIANYYSFGCNYKLPDIIPERPEHSQDNFSTLKKEEDANKEINFDEYKEEIIKLLYELNSKVPKNKTINKIHLDKDLTTFEVTKRLRIECLGEVSNNIYVNT